MNASDYWDTCHLQVGDPAAKEEARAMIGVALKRFGQAIEMILLYYPRHPCLLIPKSSSTIRDSLGIPRDSLGILPRDS